MSRIRTIVPEFWEDERFSNVSLPAWLLYIGMKNFADDSGVILANEVIIKSKVFPAREDIRKQQVSGWLKELIENSVLVPFTYENKKLLRDGLFQRTHRQTAKVKNSGRSYKKGSSFRSNRKFREHFENIPEESGTVENVPAGKDRKGEESKGEDGSITRTREEPHLRE